VNLLEWLLHIAGPDGPTTEAGVLTGSVPGDDAVARVGATA
jgi:hypothetical protein